VSFVRSAGARVVAVGECGFDGSTETFRAEAEVQRRVFFAHVEAARALDLPLVVHVLKAHGEALAAMRAVQLPRRPGVIHSFSGSAELAREYLALGWHLAMGGAITRPNARRPLEATPADVRRCEPAHLSLIAQRVAEVRGQPLARIADQTTANARALFGLTP
jgi:TatD DNase family protein